MATIRALQQGNTGGWSMSKNIRSYILCCFSSSARPSSAESGSAAGGHQQSGSGGEQYEIVDGPVAADADGSAKPRANGQVMHGGANDEHEQLANAADRQSYGSVKGVTNTSAAGAQDAKRKEDSSSDEDDDLIRQRLTRISTRSKASSKVKATAAAVAAEAAMAGSPQENDGYDDRGEISRPLASATGDDRGSRNSLSTTMDDDPRLFNIHELRGQGVDEEPPTVAASNYGSLQATIGYDHAKGGLMVTIVRANNVPTKERGGSDHSRVHVVLLASSKKVREKTKIRSGKNPEFNETFRFKIAKDDVPTSAVRMRLYGCERMKRERLLGEVLVRGGNIDLVTGTTQWHSLQPRSEMTMDAAGDDTASLTKSDSGGSASSVNSLQGGAPEILLGLAYNSSTGRLQVEIIKGSNFRSVGTGRPPDTYVKVQLLSFNRQEITRTKTSVRRGQPNPVFKESFTFQVASFQLSDISLMVSVFNKKNMKKKDMMGWCSLGHESSGEEETAHWNEMKESKGQHVNRWHTLIDS